VYENFDGPESKLKQKRLDSFRKNQLLTKQ